MEINNNLPLFHLEFFPSVIYLAKALQQKNITLQMQENFLKQTYRTRCVVFGANGLQNIIVPVKSYSVKKIPIECVEISYKENWNIQAWRTIYSAYGKSPYFEYYSPEIKEILLKKYKYLHELDIATIIFLNEKLRLDLKIYKTSEYIKKEENNFTDCFLVKNRITEGADFQEYYQCFSDKYGFQTNLSSLDLLFNLGPQAKQYLQNPGI